MEYSHEDRQRDLGFTLMEAYTLIAKILQMLPIPISIPQRIGDEWTGEKAAAALVKAEDLVWDLNLEGSTKRLISQMCLDWMCGHIFGAFDQQSPAAWKLDEVEYAIARIFGQAALVETRLNLIPDANSDEDSEEDSGEE